MKKFADADDNATEILGVPTANIMPIIGINTLLAYRIQLCLAWQL